MHSSKAKGWSVCFWQRWLYGFVSYINELIFIACKENLHNWIVTTTKILFFHVFHWKRMAWNHAKINMFFLQCEDVQRERSNTWMVQWTNSHSPEDCPCHKHVYMVYMYIYIYIYEYINIYIYIYIYIHNIIYIYIYIYSPNQL